MPRAVARRTAVLPQRMLATLAMLAAASLCGFAAAAPARAADLADATLTIAGARLTVSPESQTVPFDTPTEVLTQLQGFDTAHGTIPAGLLVLGDLTGPQISGVLTLQTVPGQPFQVPRLQTQGIYQLDNIRLMQGGNLLGYAQPRSAALTVTQVLVTSVTSRAMTADEIRGYGIVVNASSIQAYVFTFAFAVAPGQTITYNVPVVYNTAAQSPPYNPMYQAPGQDNGGIHAGPHFTPPRMAPFQLTLAPKAHDGPSGYGGCADPEGDCSSNPSLPIPGVILFPTNISLLHQFFSVILMVQNGAPGGDPLVLRDLSARVTLPPGLRQASTLPPTPLGVPIPIRVPGPDGILGTADDITFLVAQASGEAQVLTEGMEQGTHVVQFDITGVVDGLPGGQLQTVTGHAQGAVVVRDPTLNVTVTHPEVVRANEQYQLLLTVTNTGNTPANQLTLRLPPDKLAGVQVVGNNSQTIDLLPGDSQLVEFTLRSLLTGRVVADAVRNSGQITPTFDLSVGVGEHNIPLSPNAIILPDAVNSLPPDLLRADLNLIGLGYSLATAPPALLTQSSLPQVSLGAIDSRVYELAQAGVEVTMGEAAFDSAAILAVLGTGAQDQDAAWDQLRRITQKGGSAGARLAAIFAAAAAATSPAAAFNRFAATTAFVRRGTGAGGASGGGSGVAGIEGALAVGAGATLLVTSRASGLRLAGGGEDPARLRELPFADLYLLDAVGGAQMALLAVPEATGYQVTLRIAGGGTADLDLLVPAADGSVRIVSWPAVALGGAGSATAAWAPGDAAFTLAVDPQGTGVGARQLAGSVAPLAARAFGVVAAMQNAVVDPTGHVVDVLFSGDVDRSSLLPIDPSHFQVPGKLSNGGLTHVDADIVAQAEHAGAGALHNSRLLRVVFNNPLSPYATPINLTVANVKSAAGEVLASTRLPIQITVTSPGEQVSGVVIGADGNPVPFAQVTLHENDPCLLCDAPCNSHPTAIVAADGTGHYLFDYVRSTAACGDSFGLSAVDPTSNEVGVATGRVRFIGQTARLDVLMLGRGTIRGRIAYDDGTLPVNPQVVAYSPVFRLWGNPKIDAYGNYSVSNVPVGTITLSASDGLGKFVVTTLAVPSSGSVVDYDLIILRLPPKPVQTGQVSGQVVRPDGTTPVALAYVALYVDGSLIGVQRTDPNGKFDFGIVPAGQAEIDTFENETGQSGVQVFFQINPDQANQVKLRMNANRGAVEGHVYRQTGNSIAPIAGAVVWVDGTPFKTFTDTQGFYHLDGVFTGTWQVYAADLVNQIKVSQAATIEAEGATATRDLYFQVQLPSGFAGQVLDFAGNPVGGATVHLGAGSLNWWGETTTDATGAFSYTGMVPGSYTVYAYRGQVGGSAGVTIRFQGDTPFVTIRFKEGTIKGVVQAKDANGQVTGILATVTYRTTVVREGVLGGSLTPTTIQTAPDGRFEIDHVLAGPYSLSVYNSFYGSQSVSGQIVNQGEVQNQTLTFQLNGPGTIKGVVLDQDGVTPAAGASVHLAHPAFSTYDLTAGADGSFEFDLVPPTPWGFPVQVTFQSGVIFRQAQVYVSFTQPGQTLTLQIVLPKQGSVAGVVKDADGHPVPGSVVTLAEGHYPNRQLTVNADANAAFQFSNVFAGAASLAARAPTLGGLGGKTSITIDSEGQALTGVLIQLQPTGKISGRVTRPVDGSAVANAEVKLTGAIGDSINADAHGQFELDLLPLGGYDVWAFDPTTGRQGHTGGLVVATNDQVVAGDVTLEARGGVLGHLYDPDSTPPLGVPAATVALSSSGVTSLITYSSTDLQGAFQFQGIPQGNFNLAAREPGGRRNASGQGTIAHEGDQVTVDLTLQREGTVTGSALNPAGAAAGKFPNVNVTAVQDGQIIGGVLASDYSFGGIIVGRRFELDAQEVGGHHAGSVQGTLADANPVALDIQMVPLGSVRVVVQDSFGTPVPGANVTLYNTGFYGFHVYNASSSAAADAIFQDIGAGPLTAEAFDPVSLLSGSASGTLATDGQIVQLTVKLESTGTVRGKVLLADGVTPAVGATAAIRISGRSFLVQTDGAGAFAFHAVPLGDFDLNFQQSFGPGTLEVFGAVTANGQVVDLGTLVLVATDMQVLSITPADASTNVGLSQAVVVTFNQPLDPNRNTLSDGTVTVRRSDGQYWWMSGSLSADGKTLTSVPVVPYDNATTYLVQVRPPAFAVSGRQLQQLAQASFTTVDHLQPAVIHIDPAAGAAKVPVDTRLHLIFNRPVDPASLSGGHLQLLDLTTNVQVTTTFTLSPTGRELLITPQAAFAQVHEYQLTVQGVVDLVGNVQAQTFVSTFYTLDATPPVISAIQPAAGTVFTAGQPVAISFNVADDDLAAVTVSFGEQSVTLTAPPFAWTVPAPAVAAASDLPIQIVATDRSANSAAATQLVHVLPATAAGPPAVALTCPTPGAMLAPGTSLNLAVTASEASGIEKVELFVGSQGSAAPPLAKLFSPPYNFSFTPPAGATDGQVLHVRLRATSFGNTTAEAAADFTVVTGNVLTAATTIAASNAQYDGASLIVAGGTVTIDGPHSFRDLVVLDGATVNHSPTTPAQENHLVVTLTRNLYVACGGAVDVSNRGYQGAIFDNTHAWGYGNTQAEGASPTGAGGSHGGRGGRYDGSSPVYGNLFDPQDPGAGGGYQAGSPGDTDHGGGVVRITAAGAMLVDGVVRASGSQHPIGGAGGGAGGSIRLSAAALAGAGTIQALGGLPTAWPDPNLTGGGSGGRIALYAASIDAGLLSRTSAAGGAGTSSDPSTWGAAGTLFTKLDANPYGDLIIDNAGVASSQLTELLSVGSGTVTAVGATNFTDSQADFHHDLSGIDVAFNGNLGALYPIASHAHHGQTLTLQVAAPPLSATIQPGATYSGVYELGNLAVRGGAKAIAVDAVATAHPPQVASGASWTPAYAGTVALTSPAAGATVTAGAPLTVSASAADLLGVSRVVLAIAGGGSVTLTSPPYTWSTNAPAVSAPADALVTATVFAAGGNYLTASVTIHVSPAVDPLAPVVALTCWHDQDLVAAGAAIPISFTISDAVLVSSYSLVVNGATVQTVNANQAAVAASLNWTPPAGTAPGTSFTVSITAVNPAGRVGSAAMHLVVAPASALTGNLTLGSSYAGQSLVLGAGTFTLAAPLSLNALTLMSGARLVGAAGTGPAGTAGAPLSLTVAGTLTVECGGAIDASALGYLGATAYNSPGTAPPGVTASQVDAGGSHGGLGVNGPSLHGPAGDPFDSVYVPQLGGGGSSIYGTSYGARGGNGGGAMSLTAGTLQLYGQVLARGESWNQGTLARAGGAGGAVLVHAGTVAGSGSIDVSGGAADVTGSGGGGRVALYVTAFSGFDPTAQVLAHGGAASASGQVRGYGGAGTIFWKDGNATYGRLLLDSGKDASGHDQVGPATPLPVLGGGAVTAWTAAGGDAWLTAAAAFGQPWLGAWVAVTDAGGNLLGELRVSQIDAQGRALLTGGGAVHGAALYQGEYRFDRIDVQSSAGLAGSDPIKSGDVEVYGAAARLPAAQLNATSMTLNAGAVVAPAAGGTLNLAVSGQLTIQSGARIDVSSLGYLGATAYSSPGTAPAGVNPSQVDAGGSHGGPGVGINRPGPAGEVYDSVYLPQLGGGGSSIFGNGYGARGGNGGGTVSLTAGTLQLDGQVLAKGEAWNQPGSLARSGGAGGTVVVHAGTLAGAGSIDVSGGAADSGGNGGSGGGGRVALYVTTSQAFAVASQVKAQGGATTDGGPLRAYSGPGTVLDRQPGQTYGSLRVDGGSPPAGTPMPATPLPAIGAGTIGTVAPATGDPASVWITAQAGTPLFSLGVTGMWVRINGTDYPVTGQSADRTQLLLQGAAGAAAAGQHFFGVYKFDQVTVTGNAAVQASDALSAGSTQVDPGATLTYPDLLPPVISGIQPAAGTVFTAGQAVAISATVADDDLATVTISFGEQSVTLLAPPFAWTVPAPQVAAASDVAIQIAAVDRSGNSAAATRLVHVLPATASGPPAVALTCPTAGAMLAPGTSLGLAATASETSGIAKVEMFLGSATTPLAKVFSPPYAFAFTAPAGSTDGQVLHVRVRATSFGNTTAEAAADLTVATGNVLTAATAIAAANTAYDGASLIVAGTGATVTIDGPHTFRDLLVLDGGVVNHTATSAAQENHLALTLTRNLYVACGGAIDVTNLGYLGGASASAHAYGYGNATAEGAAPTGAGGSFGGRGGRYDGSSPVYGSFWNPQDPGAGGGWASGAPAGANGGGVVVVNATGAGIVDGAVRANGGQQASGGTGGGAGGSVLLNAASLAGAGVIQALGGPPTASPSPAQTGGGAGGRIALFGHTIDAGLLSRTLAAGAAGTSTDPSTWGAAGTVFAKLDTNPYGDLIVDNAGIASSQLTELLAVGSGTVTQVGSNTMTDSLADFHHDLSGISVLFNGNAAALYPILANAHHGQTLTLQVVAPPLSGAVQPGAAYSGTYTFRNVVVRGGAQAVTADAVSSTNPPQVASGSAWTPGYAGSIQITSPAGGATFTAGNPMAVSAAVTDLLGVSRVVFSVGGQSFAVSSPPYTWSTVAPGGSSPADFQLTATAYGSTGNHFSTSITIHSNPGVDAQAPVVTLGCWHDGDLVAAGSTLPISFTITDAAQVSSYSLVVNGTVVQTVTASQASVSASLNWTVPAGTAPGNSFTVQITAVNPGGHIGSSTIHLVVPSQTVTTGNLTLGSSYAGQSLVLGAGTYTVPAALSLSSLTLLSGAKVVGVAAQPLNLSVTGTLSAECGSAIDMSLLGYQGPSNYANGTAPPGVTPSQGNSGGSHGGPGTPGDVNGAPGAVFDGVYMPLLGGGSGTLTAPCCSRHGGNGGGVLSLTAGTLQLNGVLRARGEQRANPGVTEASGAGGTIVVQAGTMSGTGTIDASGEDYNGQSYAGGSGGGGRVALYVNAFQGFDPTVQAKAWGGANLTAPTTVGAYAGPGTIFWKDASATFGRLMVDSGQDASGHDRAGALTPLPVLGGGAVSSWTAAGTAAWLAAAAPFGNAWLGAWVALQDGGGNVLGEFAVSQIDGQGRALLAGAGGIAGAVQYQGEYRFDRIDLKGSAGVTASDPIKSADVEVYGAATRLPAQLTTTNMTVNPGSVAVAGVGGAVNLTVTGTLTVPAGARIDVTAQGYPGPSNYGNGTAPPGVAASQGNAGGSHGGRGTPGDVNGAPGAVFDGVYLPLLGGGSGTLTAPCCGRHGGNGGGVINLTAGTLQLGGTLRARGEQRANPGVTEASGAGGTVVVHAGTMAGAGTIDVSGEDYNGQSYAGGSGGGGRVALYVTAFQGFDPTVQVQAWGGANWTAPTIVGAYAGPGTIFWKDGSGTYGRLLVDSGKDAGGHDRAGSLTPLPVLGGGAVSSWTAAGTAAWLAAAAPFGNAWLGAWVVLQDAGGNVLGEFVVSQIDGQGRAQLAGAGGIAGAVQYQGEYRFDRIDLRSSAGLTASDPIKSGDVEVYGAATRLPAQLTTTNMTVNPGAVAVAGVGGTVNLTVTGTLTVPAGARIDVTAQGYPGPSNYGNGTAPPGVAASQGNAGGSHGGPGTPGDVNGAPGAVFDGVYLPLLGGGSGTLTAPCCGRHGGNGGGVINLTAGTLQLDGTLRARGEQRANPGVTEASGAGGTVVVHAGTMAGAGTIDVSGEDYNGQSYAGGSGGGGRVALYVTAFQGFDPTVQVQAWGGANLTAPTTVGAYAGPGTIFWKDASGTYGRLLVDSGKDAGGHDRAGSLTPLPVLGGGAVSSWTAAGTAAWLAAAAPFGNAWLWAWVALQDASGNALGEFVVSQIDGQGRAQLAGAGGVAGAVRYQGEYRFDRIDLKSSAGLTASDPIKSGDFEVYGAATRLPAQLTTTNMTVNAGSVAVAGVGSAVNLTVSGTLTIPAGARIDVTAQGFAGPSNYANGNAPPGVATSQGNAGGSHGGPGTAGDSNGHPGAVFDSAYLPAQGGGSGTLTAPCCGRHGGDGGGVINVTAGTLQLDGMLRARGEQRANPGVTEASGAGGTIVVHAGTIAGAGSIDASGEDYNGQSYAGGAGGGGRVALYLTSFQGFSPATQVKVWAGSMFSSPTTVAAYGGPGTLFWKDGSATYGRLVVDSGKGTTFSGALPVTPLPAIGVGTVGTATADAAVPANLWITASSGAAFQLGSVGMWVRVGGTDYPVLAQSADLKSLELAGAVGSVAAGAVFRGVYKFDEVDVRGGAKLQFNDTNVVGTFQVDPNSAVIQNVP